MALHLSSSSLTATAIALLLLKSGLLAPKNLANAVMLGYKPSGCKKLARLSDVGKRFTEQRHRRRAVPCQVASNR